MSQIKVKEVVRIMKVLVYGAGIIGSYIAHVLCENGHQVDLLARGKRKQDLTKYGLVIYHQLQKVETKDTPTIVDSLNRDTHYDVIFAVMQHYQMQLILDDLASANTNIVVLIGNNMTSKSMNDYILERSVNDKKVLFGFSGTGGKYQDGKLICARFGSARLVCGCVGHEVDAFTMQTLNSIFTGKYNVVYSPDMNSWLMCHATAVLPLAYVCYANDCDLTKATMKEVSMVVEAMREGYDLLKSSGYSILPEGEYQSVSKPLKRLWVAVFYWLVFKIRNVGEMAVSNHCKSAHKELHGLETCLLELRKANPNVAMPNFDALKRNCPSWESMYDVSK